MKVTPSSHGWSVSLPADEGAIILRPGGSLAQSRVAGVEVELYPDQGVRLKIPAGAAAALLSTDPFHVADLTLLRQLVPPAP
jgi:hypothetical protein